MTKPADFLADSFKKRTKVGAGFYQYSYGRRGWVSLIRKGHGAFKGQWSYSAHRHNDFFEVPDEKGVAQVFGQGPVETVDESRFYKTMAEALELAQYALITREQQAVIDAEQRAEIARTLAQLEALHGLKI